MSTKQLTMSLLVSDRSGVRSSIMLLGRDLGLMYRTCQLEKLSDNRSKMHVTFNGHLNCSKADLINTMESHPNIYSVVDISDDYFDAEAAQTSEILADSLSSDTSPTPSVSHLQAFSVITPESLQIAEEALVDILGPVAPLVVSSAASETKHIGDLFVLLSKELEGQERRNFLSLVDGLKVD